MAGQPPIIIVEDDVDDQHILKEILNDIGVDRELVFFDNCDKAFAHLMSIKQKPFLIISDINIPGTDGISFKIKIDQTDHLRMKAIPFIFLSTSGSEQFVDHAYRKTILQGYFQKTGSYENMKKQMRSIIDYWEHSLQPS